jgi:branched-chain amino acid transport system ATP-binding protein
MLKIRNLYAYYGSVTALSGITCHIKEGEIVTLIGANGAGKTTLLNAICGLVRKDGDLDFAGRSLMGLAPEEIVGLGISQVPEGRQLFAPMTVAENLELGAYRATARSPRPKSMPTWSGSFSSFPGSRTASPAGRHHERRGAADAGHRPGLDGPPPCCCWMSRPWAWPPSWWRTSWPG